MDSVDNIAEYAEMKQDLFVCIIEVNSWWNELNQMIIKEVKDEGNEVRG